MTRRVRRTWMNKAHDFREDGNDGSMCLCGIPKDQHDGWQEQKMAELRYAAEGNPRHDGRPKQYGQPIHRVLGRHR